MKYQMLVRILDRIRDEATSKWQNRYQPPESEVEKTAHARSLAFIHLYLKVTFGLVNFDERAWYITDGSYDGGIDGYYIDKESKRIYLIQAKFRNNQYNFENKPIQLDELLAMDIGRILDGETHDENGNSYNGKILQLQREVRSIPDVGRYSYTVVLLANVDSISQGNLRRLTEGIPVDVFNYERAYKDLVFPVLSGTYYYGSDLSIFIDLSNKNAGSQISYTVQTRISVCEITVLFVPTIEIAKLMSKYKNSILKFNPRSYLDLEGQAVNNSIRETITSISTNEFALFNNGITMMSDDTNINTRIGQRNQAQLTIKNPQIINGGQTSYTLSRILEENPNDPSIFAEKEVLLKVITLRDGVTEDEKVALIEEISNATNKQTPVLTADRFSNEVFHKRLQQIMFQRYGILYERKRGEFSDGQRQKYIRHGDIIERNLLLRLYYASNGSIEKGVEKKLFQKNRLSDFDLNDELKLDRLYVGFQVFKELMKDRDPHKPLDKALYGKVFAYIEMFANGSASAATESLADNLKRLDVEWTEFMMEMRRTSQYGRKAYKDKVTGEWMENFVEARYYRNPKFARDIRAFFGSRGTRC